VQRALGDGSLTGPPLGYAGLVLLPAVAPAAPAGTHSSGGGGAGRTPALLPAV
jgi:hypothetical protein